MNGPEIEGGQFKPLKTNSLPLPRTMVPVHFGVEWPGFSVPVKSQNPMKQPVEKPPISSPKTIPAGQAESVPALKSALARGRVPLSEMMLDARKVEAALKAIVRRKRLSGRRLASRLGKAISLNGRQLA